MLLGPSRLKAEGPSSLAALPPGQPRGPLCFMLAEHHHRKGLSHASGPADPQEATERLSIDCFINLLERKEKNPCKYS